MRGNPFLVGANNKLDVAKLPAVQQPTEVLVKSTLRVSGKLQTERLKLHGGAFTSSIADAQLK